MFTLCTDLFAQRMNFVFSLHAFYGFTSNGVSLSHLLDYILDLYKGIVRFKSWVIERLQIEKWFRYR